jgi:hypothetical protein
VKNKYIKNLEEGLKKIWKKSGKNKLPDHKIGLA